ncbi:PREDICTED: putative nuclear RNA export factor SDE5 [Lupinus angustifolius]|uniref:putative nuclear RNA export factor SDE5 n=1 Tax=Lupinus angustifolius TaxID=3871 RepID=UPI00092F2D23|nr:PREDICTED: putative nuclear RNA export factor SDE5 [Lupinus angustifolius]
MLCCEELLKMNSLSDIEERDLKGLLESFASTFSLEDIATAYCGANRDVNLAAEILCTSKDEFKGATASETTEKLSPMSSTASEPAKKISAMSSSASVVPKSFDGQRNFGAGKSKFQPASLGSVTGFVGKDYLRHKKSTKPYQEVKKPLKLDATELPESVIWGEKSSMGTESSKGHMKDEVVNFLIKMLGDGFELEKEKIVDVLALCGFDVEKTMEKLLDMSFSTLKKCDDISNLAVENPRDQHSAANYASNEELHNSTDSPKSNKDRVGLQKEILESLFDYPERPEELSQRRLPVREIPNRRYHISVAKLIEDEDTATIQCTTVVDPQVVKEESDDENSYKVLRKAVKENWTTMKEYYRSAVEAFSMGDYARVDRLLEQGLFYNKKAREADEKSAQKVLQTNETNDDDSMPLDLVEHEPKDALRLLKFHLTSLSGISSIKYLRAVVGTGHEDIKGARKRLMTKLLKKNSIEWTEEDNGRILCIQVDIIDPKSLSFGPKK